MAKKRGTTRSAVEELDDVLDRLERDPDNAALKAERDTLRAEIQDDKDRAASAERRRLRDAAANTAEEKAKEHRELEDTCAQVIDVHLAGISKLAPLAVAKISEAVALLEKVDAHAQAVHSLGYRMNRTALGNFDLATRSAAVLSMARGSIDHAIASALLPLHRPPMLEVRPVGYPKELPAQLAIDHDRIVRRLRAVVEQHGAEKPAPPGVEDRFIRDGAKGAAKKQAEMAQRAEAGPVKLRPARDLV